MLCDRYSKAFIIYLTRSDLFAFVRARDTLDDSLTDNMWQGSIRFSICCEFAGESGFQPEYILDVVATKIHEGSPSVF